MELKKQQKTHTAFMFADNAAELIERRNGCVRIVIANCTITLTTLIREQKTRRSYGTNNKFIPTIWGGGVQI